MTDTVESVLALGRNGLLERWETVFGRKPPPHTHASFMRLALAWQVQAGGKAGASPELPGVRQRTRRASAILRPGTRLVREWQGTTYHVLVSDRGFVHAGKTYRSLSAIARQITGTPWSGPAFFGVGR